MFVLSCNLGQRFSDMIRIDKSCFDRNIFSILQQKTGTSVRVDIERMSLDRNTTYEILEKYNYKSPLSTDISCYDRYLKQLLMQFGKFNHYSIRYLKLSSLSFLVFSGNDIWRYQTGPYVIIFIRNMNSIMLCHFKRQFTILEICIKQININDIFLFTKI